MVGWVTVWVGEGGFVGISGGTIKGQFFLEEIGNIIGTFSEGD